MYGWKYIVKRIFEEIYCWSLLAGLLAAVYWLAQISHELANSKLLIGVAE